MVRFTEAAAPGCDAFRNFAHRALCARAIFGRETAEMTRAGWIASLPLVPNRLMTRLLKSPYPTSPLATGFLAAQHEAAEAHWSDLT